MPSLALPPVIIWVRASSVWEENRTLPFILDEIAEVGLAVDVIRNSGLASRVADIVPVEHVKTALALRVR